MKIRTDFVQGSDEWREARCGKATASEFDKIVTPTKGDLSKSCRDYAARLAGERLTGGFEDVREIFDPHMLRGIEQEPRARAAYEYVTNSHVRTVGFIESDCKSFGCSPDGLVYANADDPYENPIGGLEFKCPTLANFLLYHEEGCLPNKYRCQVHGSLAVSGLPFWDFAAFHANFPDQLFRVRVTPDDFTQAIKDALPKFEAVVQGMVERAARLSLTPAGEVG